MVVWLGLEAQLLNFIELLGNLDWDASLLGNWEVDTAHGAEDSGTFIIAVEKISHSAIAKFLGGKSSTIVLSALVEALLPFKVRSIRFDNGPENAEYNILIAAFGSDVAFCQPRSPREKAQVEERIKKVREAVGRCTSFLGFHQWELDKITDHFDDKPMEILRDRETGQWLPLTHI